MFCKDKFKLKTASMIIWYRKMEEIDLLAVDGFIPIFDVKKPDSDIGKLIAESEDEAAEQDYTEFKRSVVHRCVIDIKPRKGLDKKAVLTLIDGDVFLNALYRLILLKSVNPCNFQKINRKQAISIYANYKGMNYAREFFGEGRLNKVEEYGFNCLIRSVGRQEEERQAKEARMKAKVK